MADDRGAQLAALIDENPHDVDAYRAYGDWLEEQGDSLRGQFMGMHMLRDRLASSLKVDRTKLDHLEARLTAFFDEHHDHFWGALAKLVPKSTAPRGKRDQAPKIEWRNGFIYRAELPRNTRRPMHELLEQLVSHPSGRFLVELHATGAPDGDALVHAIAARTRLSLRRLEIGPVPALKLWPALPRLTDLTLYNCTGYGRIELPALQRLTLHHCGDPKDFVRGLANGSLPALRTLVLDFLANVEAILHELAQTDVQLTSLELFDVRQADGTPFASIAREIEH